MCAQPNVEIDQSFPLVSPVSVYRSALLSLSTVTYFACNSSYILTYTWLASRMDIAQTIDLTTNPTSASSQLIISANSLAYGLYNFTFRVEVAMWDNSVLSNSANTFVQIVPTGLAVYALRNGISSILIGSQQKLVLNPATYSIDLDDFISPSSLQYTFYCNTINLNLKTESPDEPDEYQIEQMSIAAKDDLLAYKINPQLAMAANRTCFSSNCKSIFEKRLNTKRAEFYT